MRSDVQPASSNPKFREDFSVGVFGPVVAVVWAGAVTVAAVARVSYVLEQTARVSIRPVAFLTVAQFKAPLPPAEVQDNIVACYRRLGTKLSCVGQVVEGDGFWACGARCFIAGLGLLSNRQQPAAVYGDVDSAVNWMRRWIAEPVDVDVVANGVASLRMPGG